MSIFLPIELTYYGRYLIASGRTRVGLWFRLLRLIRTIVLLFSFAGWWWIIVDICRRKDFYDDNIAPRYMYNGMDKDMIQYRGTFSWA